MYQIQNPSGTASSSSYGGHYLEFDDTGVATAKVLSPGLTRWLRAAGYTVTDLDEEPEAALGYSPDDHKVGDVVKYLAKADKDERDRVLALEKAGKARQGVLGWTLDTEGDSA